MRPLRIKPGCDFTGLHPDIPMWAGVVAGHHLEVTGKQLWITSARRPYREGVRSYHSPPPCAVHWTDCDLSRPDCLPGRVCAFDFRRWYLDTEPGRAEDFCKMLQARYGGHLGIVLEPEWLSTRAIRARGGIGKISSHIHCQTKATLFSWGTVL